MDPDGPVDAEPARLERVVGRAARDRPARVGPSPRLVRGVPRGVDLLALDPEQAARRVEAGLADRDAVGLGVPEALEEPELEAVAVDREDGVVRAPDLLRGRVRAVGVELRLQLARQGGLGKGLVDRARELVLVDRAPDLPLAQEDLGQRDAHVGVLGLARDLAVDAVRERAHEPLVVAQGERHLDPGTLVAARVVRALGRAERVEADLRVRRGQRELAAGAADEDGPVDERAQRQLEVLRRLLDVLAAEIDPAGLDAGRDDLARLERALWLLLGERGRGQQDRAQQAGEGDATPKAHGREGSGGLQAARKTACAGAPCSTKNSSM